MERVVILGPGGAGKTTVANELAERTGLPLVYLDRIFWRKSWAPAPRDEAERELAEAVEHERWILDGNFLASPCGRFERADTVVFLDLSRRLCLWRVLSRCVRDRSRSRADLPASEGFDLELLRWIWRYSRVDRPRVLELLEGLPEQVRVHRLRTRAEVRVFLESSQATSSR